MRFSKETFGLYLLTGIWNTAFGYAVYSFFTYLLSLQHVEFSYMYAYVLGNMISVTQSFVMYKYLVFRSPGNFWQEYKKCWIVYGTTLLMSFLMLPLCVYLSGVMLHSDYAELDKYFGGIIVTAIVAIGGFWGHQNITFRK